MALEMEALPEDSWFRMTDSGCIPLSFAIGRTEPWLVDVLGYETWRSCDANKEGGIWERQTNFERQERQTNFERR